MGKCGKKTFFRTKSAARGGLIPADYCTMKTWVKVLSLTLQVSLSPERVMLTLKVFPRGPVKSDSWPKVIKLSETTLVSLKRGTREKTFWQSNSPISLQTTDQLQGWAIVNHFGEHISRTGFSQLFQVFRFRVESLEKSLATAYGFFLPSTSKKAQFGYIFWNLPEKAIS